MKNHHDDLLIEIRYSENRRKRFVRIAATLWIQSYLKSNARNWLDLRIGLISPSLIDAMASDIYEHMLNLEKQNRRLSLSNIYQKIISLCNFLFLDAPDDDPGGGKKHIKRYLESLINISYILGQLDDTGKRYIANKLLYRIHCANRELDTSPRPILGGGAFRSALREIAERNVLVRQPLSKHVIFISHSTEDKLWCLRLTRALLSYTAGADGLSPTVATTELSPCRGIAAINKLISERLSEPEIFISSSVIDRFQPLRLTQTLLSDTAGADVLWPTVATTGLSPCRGIVAINKLISERLPMHTIFLSYPAWWTHESAKRGSTITLCKHKVWPSVNQGSESSQRIMDARHVSRHQCGIDIDAALQALFNHLDSSLSSGDESSIDVEQAFHLIVKYYTLRLANYVQTLSVHLVVDPKDLYAHAWIMLLTRGKNIKCRSAEGVYGWLKRVIYKHYFELVAKHIKALRSTVFLDLSDRGETKRVSSGVPRGSDTDILLKSDMRRKAERYFCESRKDGTFMIANSTLQCICLIKRPQYAAVSAVYRARLSFSLSSFGMPPLWSVSTIVKISFKALAVAIFGKPRIDNGATFCTRIGLNQAKVSGVSIGGKMPLIIRIGAKLPGALEKSPGLLLSHHESKNAMIQDEIENGDRSVFDTPLEIALSDLVLGDFKNPVGCRPQFGLRSSIRLGEEGVDCN